MYTNTFNGKKYIGLTKRGTSKRNFDHVKKAREGKGNAFHAAIRKYGMDSFLLQELACCKTIEDARHTEEQLIKSYKSFITDEGYNLTHGGEARFFTKEEIEKTRKRMIENNPMKRPEVAKKVSESLKGRPGTTTGMKIEKLTGPNNPRYGKKQSKEEIEKRAILLRKKYIATFSDGSTEEIDNLKQFCLSRDLSYGAARHMIGRTYKKDGLRIDRANL